MTRIIAGVAGGRRLQTPPGQGTRPTSDRVREALFSRLDHLDVVDGAHVLDLFAGSGALGLEAASRGAASVLLVESDRRTAAVIKRNIEATGLTQARVLTVAAEQALSQAPPEGSIDVVFVDPPYDLAEAALTRVLDAARAWLAQDALLVVERSSRSPEPTWPTDTHLVGPRRYGETTVWFAEFVPEGDAA